METKIGNPDNLILLVMVFVTAGLAAFVAWNRRRSLQQLASANLLPSLLPGGTSAPWMATGLLCASFFFLTLSLLDLRWGKVEHEIPQKGIEVVFALDVSRSMLAEDTSPNRLERAKQQIKDLMDEMVGDRVGLVAFAGEAKTVIPLTSHYDDFKSTLDGVGPHTIRVGGSRLGTALDVAAKDFLSQTNNHKAVIVLTDGEDQESDPVGVARRVFQEQGIRVFTIGLGDWQRGSKIPVESMDTRRRDREGYLTYQGDTVWSKQDGETLKSIALATSGAYIPAGTKYVDMEQVYRSYIAPIEKTQFETATVQAYEARYQWFAVPAMLCLLGEVIWRTRAKKEKRKSSKENRQPGKKEEVTATRPQVSLAQRVTAKSVSIGILCFLLCVPSSTSTLAQVLEPSIEPIELPAAETRLIRQANEKLEAGELQEALSMFEQLDTTKTTGADLLQYNRGVAQYGLGELEKAMESFRSAAGSSNQRLAALSRYNLGNCLVESAEGAEPEAAMSQLNQAIQSYRDALRLNSNLSDARANIETAFRRLQELKTQREQEQSQQDQEDQPSDRQDQSQQSSSGESRQDSQMQDESSVEKNENQEQENQDSDGQQNQSDQGNENSAQSQSGASNAEPESADQTDAKQESAGQENTGQEIAGQENAGKDNTGKDSQQPNDQAQSKPSQDGAGESESGRDPDVEKGNSSDNRQSQENSEPGQAGEQESDTAKSTGQTQGDPLESGNSDTSQQPEAGASANDRLKDSSRAQSGDRDQPGRQDQRERFSDTQTQQPESDDEEDRAAGGQGAEGMGQEGELSSANEQFETASSDSKTGENQKAMSFQEAMKMLQAIRDRDFQRRAELQRRERMLHVPVERDW